ncbi:hypothetical protein TNCV_3253441 [Trichonephila clavipes]|nr:hypothetical protein TNCV_3253441 [Trichonephila clavipes]
MDLVYFELQSRTTDELASPLLASSPRQVLNLDRLDMSLNRAGLQWHETQGQTHGQVTRLTPEMEPHSSRRHRLDQILYKVFLGNQLITRPMRPTIITE